MPAIRFAVYRTSDGTITRTGVCPQEWLNIQPMDGEAALQADEGVTNMTHKVVDGAIVAVDSQ